MDGKMVVVGASSGGIDAFAKLLSALPRELGGTVAAVLHRGEASGEELTRHLQAASILPVREAQDKDDLRRGTVYIAPSNYHLLVEKDGLALSTGSPVAWARPSIDVLFESAADAWGKQVIGVILTGANSDGAKGLARIKERGGVTIVQEPSGAEYPSMPRAAIAASRIDHVLTLAEIPPLLARLCPGLTG
jgi:two-component system chemotaxis response regulator CheB